MVFFPALFSGKHAQHAMFIIVDFGLSFGCRAVQCFKLMFFAVYVSIIARLWIANGTNPVIVNTIEHVIRAMVTDI